MIRIPVIRNRRRCSRRIVHSPVLVSLNGSSGLLYNLSEGGLGVDVMGPPPPNQLISLTFKLPGGNQPIEASAQLAWKEDPGRRAGLRFVELPDTSQQWIKGWLCSQAIGLDGEEADRAQPETLTPAPVELSVPEPEASSTIPPVTGAASEEPAADSAAPRRAAIQPEALGLLGFASRDADRPRGLEQDDTIVEDLRAALFRAAGVREAKPSQPVVPEVLAGQRRHWHNLIFAVVGGSLVGVALGVGILLLAGYRAQASAGLDNIERSLAGLFTRSKNTIPPIAPAQPDATKPTGSGRSDIEGQPAPATASAPTELVPASAVPQLAQGRISQETSGEVPTQQVPLAYPLLALKSNVQGRVVLQATVGKDGRVRNVRLISGHPILASAVLDAVKQWRYNPAYGKGAPVEVERRITVDFVISTD